jgi:sporulation protein YlmC with PRC-barrel domain/osmotically-inducible protein OsmY
MKKILKLSLVSLCASGAAFTTQVAQANHDRSASDERSDKQLVITEPAGADASASLSSSASASGSTIRTSNLIGQHVVDNQGKHCGAVRDALIDLNSGRLAFLIINNRGKDIAVPGDAVRAEGNEFVINVPRERLASAPAFNYSQINDPSWAQQTYSYYGQSSQGGQVSMNNSEQNWQQPSTPYQSSGSTAYQSSGTTYQSGSSYQSGASYQGNMYPNRGFYEASGAQLGGPRMVTGRDQDCYADCILHQYQAGKGSARVTDEHYWNNVSPDRLYAQYPAGGTEMYRNYAYSGGYSGYAQPSAGWSSSSQQSWNTSGSQQGGQIWYGPGGRTYSSSGESASVGTSSSPMVNEAAGASANANMHLFRSSELVGMHVRGSNGQDMGTVRDVVLDLNSGRVAYAVVVPTGTEFGGKYLAVPPAAFTRGSGDQHVLTLNMSSDQLRNAPSFEANNWPQPQNQTFVTEVYNFYHVAPYWQGNQGEMHRNMHHQGYHSGAGTSGSYQGSTSTDQQNLNQGSTQGSIQNQGSSEQNLNNQDQNQNQKSVTEPSGTGTDEKGAEYHGSTSNLQGDQSSSSSSSSDLNKSNDQGLNSSSSSDLNKSSSSSASSANEPAGAQSSATQSGTSGQQSSTELKSSQNQPGSATSEAAGAATGTESSTQPSSSTSTDANSSASGNQSSATTSSPDQTSTSSSSTQPSTQTSTADQANQGLSEKVRTSLRSDSNLSTLSGKVQVSDQNGKVALTGNVASEAEKQQIVSKAEEVAGSGNVIDNLQVKSDSNSSNP